VKTKTMQEIADFFDEPIEVSNGEVVFSECPIERFPLPVIGDWSDKPNGYRVNPDSNTDKICFGRIVDYFNNCDIGASSKTMLIALLDGTPKEINYPLDNGDFERCYSVFDNFPDLFNNIDKVSKLSNEWKYITLIWKTFGLKYCKENIDSTSLLADIIKQYMNCPFSKDSVSQMRKMLKNCK
jgi:hypothetical protein